MSISPAAVASPQQLYQGQPGTAVSTLYTAPASSGNVPSPCATAQITELILANNTATAAAVTLYLVPNGGTAGAANAILAAVSVAANDTKYLSDLKTLFPPGASLQGLQATAAAITVTASGVTYQ